METTDAKEALKLLYEGKKLALSFDSPASRATFRSLLFRAKRIEDEVLRVLLEEQKKKLVFQNTKKTDGSYGAILFLRDGSSKPTSFEILPEAEEVKETEKGDRESEQRQEIRTDMD